VAKLMTDERVIGGGNRKHSRIANSAGIEIHASRWLTRRCVGDVDETWMNNHREPIVGF
jgi:hypothetical protein